MYMHQNTCFIDQDAYHAYLASHCPVMLNDGTSVACTPNAQGYLVTKTLNGVSQTQQVFPANNDCYIDFQLLGVVNGGLAMIVVAGFIWYHLRRTL